MPSAPDACLLHATGWPGTGQWRLALLCSSLIGYMAGRRKTGAQSKTVLLEVPTHSYSCPHFLQVWLLKMPKYAVGTSMSAYSIPQLSIPSVHTNFGGHNLHMRHKFLAGGEYYGRQRGGFLEHCHSHHPRDFCF
jgi:hypothetical protein